MKLLAVAASYTCPMHPDVVSSEAGHCPKCGMKLLPSQLVSESHDSHGHEHSTEGGIEWEDDMVDVNKLTTPANMGWKVDRSRERRREPSDQLLAGTDRTAALDEKHPLNGLPA